MRARDACLASALVAAAFAACDNGSSPPTDAGPDVVAEAAPIDAADETIVDAAPEAEAEADAAVPCGDLTTVWTTDLPQDLACVGLYTNLQTKTVDPSAMPYTPGLILWSDGATKQRWLYLPPNTKIDDTDLDEWTFPVGTKVFKEFEVDGARVETRIFTKAQDGSWLWATYQWNSGETDAVRNDNGATNIGDAGTYEIPSHQKCNQCHQGRNDKLLGVETIALSLATAQGVTLDWLAKNNKLTSIPSATTATLPNDSTNDAPAALGMLHINCGVSCHTRNPQGYANSTGLYMRLPAAQVLAGGVVVTSLDTYTTSANVTPTLPQYQSYAQQGYKRLAPGSSATSLIVTVANTRGTGQMPPIATHVVDTAGVTALTTWIDAL
jgi:hypothetical protein